MAITRPTNYGTPFANSGTKNTIPVASTGTGQASFTDGFPAVTMIPLTAGGIPPEGKDFNGILYDITTHTVWVNAGGQYQFDAALATAIGGYPVGMVIQSNDGLSSYVNVLLGNTTDFNTTPASIGVSWLPWAGAALDGNYVKKVGSQSMQGPLTITAGDLSLSNNNLTGVKNATYNSQRVIASTSGAITIDWSLGGVVKQTEPTGTITYTFTAPPAPCRLQILVDSDGVSTAQTVNFPGTVKWIGATWAALANKAAIISFWYDGTIYWAMGSNQV